MSISIRIVPIDRLENFDPSTWPKCKNTSCKHGRIFGMGTQSYLLRVLPLNASADNDCKPLRTCITWASVTAAASFMCGVLVATILYWSLMTTKRIMAIIADAGFRGFGLPRWKKTKTSTSRPTFTWLWELER